MYNKNHKTSVFFPTNSKVAELLALYGNMKTRDFALS